MVPRAALATMMQTPRPPCSEPHRPAPRDRRGFRRPRPWGGPLASQAEPSLAPAAREGGVPPGTGRARGPVACRVLAGWVSSGWAGSLRVGGPSPAPRGLAPRPFGPLPVRSPAPRPSQPGSRPRWLASRGAASRGLASRGLASGGTPGGRGPPAAGGRPAVPPRAPGGGAGTGPRGLAPGSPPYGPLGRVSRHRGSLIGASDVSRCGLVTGT